MIGKNAVWVCFAAGILTLTGCRWSSDRIGLSGEVNYKGEKVADGWITFVPQDADRGNQEAARITDGKYVLPEEKGLKPGDYRVAITASEPGAKPAADELPGSPRRSKSLIPAEYNTNSKLSIEVSAEGKREFNFNLD